MANIVNKDSPTRLHNCVNNLVEIPSDLPFLLGLPSSPHSSTFWGTSSRVISNHSSNFVNRFGEIPWDLHYWQNLHNLTHLPRSVNLVNANLPISLLHEVLEISVCLPCTLLSKPRECLLAFHCEFKLPFYNRYSLIRFPREFDWDAFHSVRPTCQRD